MFDKGIFLGLCVPLDGSSSPMNRNLAYVKYTVQSGKASDCPCRHTIACRVKDSSMPGDFPSQRALRQLCLRDEQIWC